MKCSRAQGTQKWIMSVLILIDSTAIVKRNPLGIGLLLLPVPGPGPLFDVEKLNPTHQAEARWF